MPRRDYARSPKSTGVNKPLIVTLILLLLALAVGALWLLKDNAPVPATTKPEQSASANAPKSSLPSRPEEVYSYIRDLETREIPVSKEEKYVKEQAQLNAKQEQLLKEQKAAEEKRLAEQQKPPTEQQAATSAEPVVTTEITQSADQELAALKAKELEQKMAEEKRLAERKKQEAERKKQELALKEKEKQAQQAKAAKEQTTPAKAPEVAAKSVSKFGLQCGAFKNRAQAENMQARLVMSGYNARINASADWNRVVVGPIGDRSAAASAQANAKAVADCVIVGM